MAKKEKELDLYLVDKKYIRDLSKADDNIMSVSPQIGKNERPFVGVVMILGEREYCIPLTSPKDKFQIKSKEDFIKIPDSKLKNSGGAPVTIGILNINNMIPISRKYISKLDLSQSSDIEKKRRILLILFLYQPVDKSLQVDSAVLCTAGAAKPPRKPFNTNFVKTVGFDCRLFRRLCL